MQNFRISGHFRVETPEDSTFSLDLINWGAEKRRQRSGVIIDISDDTIDQSNMDCAIDSILSAHSVNVESLVKQMCKVRLVMGFFFDTSKVSAFGIDISEHVISTLSRLHIDITIDVFPCSELED